MNKETLIATAHTLRPDFIHATQDEPYQLRGIFTSEALLVVSVVHLAHVHLLIESGRARGYSTRLFAKTLTTSTQTKIMSIDIDQTSPDAQFSEQQLKQFPHVILQYGDARIRMQECITEPCVLFIDGPKGDEALLLAAHCMENSLVKAVCIHDLHKNTFHRNICEMIFTHTFFSDDQDYVEAFSSLDDVCWKVLKDHGEAPYLRKGREIASYASTVGVIVNGTNAIRKDVLSNYQAYYAQTQASLVKKIGRYIQKYPRIAKPLFALYKHLT